MRCFNWKVLGGLGAAGLALLVVAPSAFSAAFPLLIVLACPLSMVFMIRAMNTGQCRRDEAESPAARSESVRSPHEELARLRAEVDQLRAERAALEAQPVHDDGVGLEDRR